MGCNGECNSGQLDTRNERRGRRSHSLNDLGGVVPPLGANVSTTPQRRSVERRVDTVPRIGDTTPIISTPPSTVARRKSTHCDPGGYYMFLIALVEDCRLTCCEALGWMIEYIAYCADSASEFRSMLDNFFNGSVFGFGPGHSGGSIGNICSSKFRGTCPMGFNPSANANGPSVISHFSTILNTNDFWDWWNTDRDRGELARERTGRRRPWLINQHEAEVFHR